MVGRRIAPHHLAEFPLADTPLVGERGDQQKAPAALTRLVEDTGDAGPAVVHLHPQHHTVVAQEHPELAARRHTVHQRVGRQLADAQHHVVPPPASGEPPAGQGLVGEPPGGRDGTPLAPEEPLAQGRELNHLVHGTSVAESDYLGSPGEPVQIFCTGSFGVTYGQVRGVGPA
ncbi:hypothetical protein GCM10022207_89910 [Streptomyces lannensis]|uniref:Uncharacterized protein n=1 Tax=Streptomyces lannensis TaxID=766498 RepID=A0ABP7LW23_9ACTN